MEEIIVTKLKNKEEEALEWLMDEYASLVYFLLHRMVGLIASKEDLEELSSEVFIRVWNEIESYDASKGTLKTYLLMKAKYIGLTFKRKQEQKMNRFEKTDMECLVDSHSIEKEITKREVVNRIYHFVKALKEPDRSYFVMRYYWQYELKQIATHFGVSVKSIESSLYRTRKKLKQLKESEGLEWIN